MAQAAAKLPAQRRRRQPDVGSCKGPRILLSSPLYVAMRWRQNRRATFRKGKHRLHIIIAIELGTQKAVIYSQVGATGKGQRLLRGAGIPFTAYLVTHTKQVTPRKRGKYTTQSGARSACQRRHAATAVCAQCPVHRKRALYFACRLCEAVGCEKGLFLFS